MVPNGELATLLLFAPLATFSLFGMRVIDRRRQAELGREHWLELASRTSLLPGAAWLSGRWRPAWVCFPWQRVLSGALMYVLLLRVHPWLIGVPAMPPGAIAPFN